MLYSLIPLLLLTLTAVSLCLIFRKQFADMLAPVLFSVMLILYGFYIFDLLHTGRSVVIILCVLSILAAVLLRRGEKGAVKEILFSPAFLLYLVGILVFFLFSWGKFVNLWDSLRLWGAYPKALHATGSLQLGEDAMLYPIMQSYPPGMPLLCFFFTIFSQYFSESTLFFTYSLFGFSLMLPFLGGMDWKNKRTLIPVFLAVLFLPWMITSLNGDDGFYYSSLFIDIPLGICCGYFLYRAFHSIKKGNLEHICALLSCGCLVLLKDSGSFMAVCGILGSLLCGFVRRKETKFLKCILWAMAEGILLVFLWGSWKYLLNFSGVSNHIQLDFSMPSLVTLARIFFHFIRTPISGFFTVTGAIQFSLPAALLFIFGVKLLLAYHDRQTRLAAEIADVAVQTLCCAGFFLGYCFSFLSNIENQEYPSYSRYMCTLLTSALYILAADCRFKHRGFLHSLVLETSSFLRRQIPLANLLRSTGFLIRITLILALAFESVLILFDFPSKQETIYVEAAETAGVLTEAIGSSHADVYLCIPGSAAINSRLHHRTYFELIDDGIRIQNFYTETDITENGCGFTPESFLEHLISNGYEYVMLTSVDDSLMEEFGSLFIDAAVEDTNLLYKIDEVQNCLIRIR